MEFQKRVTKTTFFFFPNLKDPYLCVCYLDDLTKHKILQAGESVGTKIRSMYKTMMHPQVWRPSLYIFLALALSVTTHEGHFYWYTDSTAGPAFSQVHLSYAACKMTKEKAIFSTQHSFLSICNFFFLGFKEILVKFGGREKDGR